MVECLFYRITCWGEKKKKNQTQSSRTRLGNWSEYMFRLIDLKSYFTVVSLKDMGFSKDNKMTSNWGCSERRVSLVYAGSLPGHTYGC